MLRFLVHYLAVAQLLRGEERRPGVQHQDRRRDHRGGDAPAEQAREDAGDGQQRGAHAEFREHPRRILRWVQPMARSVPASLRRLRT